MRAESSRVSTWPKPSRGFEACQFPTILSKDSGAGGDKQPEEPGRKTRSADPLVTILIQVAPAALLAVKEWPFTGMTGRSITSGS